MKYKSIKNKNTYNNLLMNTQYKKLQTDIKKGSFCMWLKLNCCKIDL